MRVSEDALRLDKHFIFMEALPHTLSTPPPSLSTPQHHYPTMVSCLPLSLPPSDMGTFLLAAAVNGVIKVAIDEEGNDTLQVPLSLNSAAGVSDVAWDSKENLMFWSDKRKRTISVSHITVSAACNSRVQ